MNIEDLKTLLQKAVPSVKYFYIQRIPLSIKGVPSYNIYFNTRIPTAKLSISAIAKQDVFSTVIVMGGKIKRLKAEIPLPIESYSRPILPNAIINFVDLAGEFYAEGKNL